MIPTIRLHSQQLINPVFNNPKDLVSWMGGIQAQDYTMSKWAIGIRLKAGNLQTVNEALAKGDIIAHSCHASYLALCSCRRYTLDAEAFIPTHHYCQ